MRKQEMNSVEALMSRESCLSAAQRWLDDGRLLETMRRRVAFESESDANRPPETLLPYLADEMVPELAKLGFICKIFKNPEPSGGPFLIARRVESLSFPTMLTYGHGDVVSGQAARWRQGLTPWSVTVEGDRWYGRGTADNKGQHSISLAALTEVIAAKNGRLGYNVTVLIEMGEEAGSPGLHDFCEAHRDGLLKADLFVGCDGPRVRADRPTLFLGSRGMVNFSLSIKARERSYHSGNWGGVLSNPATILANAISCLVDGKGVLLVDGLRPAPMPKAVRIALQSIEFGGAPGDPSFEIGWGEPGLTPGERLVGFNTLEVLALGSGAAERPVNAIPPAAIAHLQLRFVVGTDWKNLKPLVETALRDAGYDGIEVRIAMATPATRLDLDNPWVDWTSKSIESSTGCPTTVLPNLAGSLPNEVFSDVLGLPTLWIPHSYPACGQHGPDEHLLVSIAREGLKVMAGIYWDLASADAPWSNAV